MSEALSAADRSSLAAERGPVSMAVGGLLVLDGPVTHAQVLERVEQRIHLLPRFRQVARDPLGGLSNPAWVDDPGFDASWHVRRAGLPSPAGAAELDGLVGQEMAQRLERDRPLWEIVVIEGLAGERTALLLKIHHALADGIAAIAAGALLLDPTPEPLDIPPPDEVWAPRPDRMAQYLRSMATGPVERATRLALEGAARARDPNPRRAAGELRRATELVAEIARSRPQAPMTVLNEPLGTGRAFAHLSADLATLKAAGKAAGGTVNDAVLAAVAGMLGEYLKEAGGDLGGRRPVALVPVSVRGDDDAGDLGNRISMVFVDLPVDVGDPAGRIAALAETTKAAKESPAVRAGALLVGAGGLAPPLLSGMLGRAMGSVRACNLVVSNVPGPQQPFYVSGARVLAAHPAVPLNPANLRLSVGVLSYDGGVHFGLLADRALRPGVESAAAKLSSALAALDG